MTRSCEDIVIGSGLPESSNNLINNTNSNGDFYPFYILKRRRSSNRRRSSLQSFQNRHRFRLVRRLVRKSGKTSVHRKTSSEHSYRFLLDLSNTLIEGSWIWTLLCVSLSFIITWVMFAGFWAIIAIDNDDIQGENVTERCVGGIYSFAGFLLFSIETQTSIGYGSRYLNDYCPEAVILLCVQIILGLGICGSLICIMYLKMVAPIQNKHSMVCFSKKAVVCQRDGELCLIFRVRDYHKNYECHTKIVAFLVENKSGELQMASVKLEPPGILIWPLEVIHKINRTSPFWDISAKDLMIKRLELIVVMEGSSLATSSLARTTTSYLSREILWGYKFKECTTYDKEVRKFVVNHKLFTKTEEVLTPLCSARRLKEVFEDILSVTSYSYSASVSDTNTSKFASPITLSPLTKHTEVFQQVIKEDSYVDYPIQGNNENNNNELTTAVIHQPQTRTSMTLMKKVDRHSTTPAKEVKVQDGAVTSDSEDEEYTTFMDLSIEDLTERNVKSYNSLGGKAKDLLSNLQKFVSDDNSSRLSYLERNYKETDF